MEDTSDSPIAVRVEKHSQYVILTYFKGDINSMVDAHFTRALSKVSKAKAPAGKPKKNHKSIKPEETSACQNSAVDPYQDSQLAQMGHLLTFTTANDTSDAWHPFTTRAGEATGLPTIAYSLSPEGLSVTGQQYANSLLNLLHNDRCDVGTSGASSSKPELLPSWTVPQGFREPLDPTVGFEPGRHMDKKDLYWY